MEFLDVASEPDRKQMFPEHITRQEFVHMYILYVKIFFVYILCKYIHVHNIACKIMETFIRNFGLPHHSILS